MHFIFKKLRYLKFVERYKTQSSIKTEYLTNRLRVIYIHTHTHIYIYTYIYIYMHIYIYIYIQCIYINKIYRYIDI